MFKNFLLPNKIVNRFFQVICLVTFAFLPQLVLCQNNQMQNAIELYNNGKYQEAADQYETLIESNLHSLELYYNLGNCFFRLEAWSKAILNYEKALLLAPKDEDVLHNLKIAEQKINQPIESINEFFLIQWRNQLLSFASIKTWSTLSVIFLWLGITGIFIWLIKSERQIKIYGFVGGGASLLISLLFLVCANTKLNQQIHSGSGIIMQDQLQLQSAPDQESKTIQPVFAGYKIKFLDQIGAWYKIKLSDGNVGWVPIDAVEEIRVR